ncbi:MAG: thymidylate synthase [Candidatus Bathyarchaeota archaeon]|nr:thymidylate synthase [Candidatus Bathyarchaeota archaeon]
MKHVKISAFDCPDAWFKALSRIWEEGDTFKVGFGSEETETKKLNITIEIAHPENRPLVSDKAPCDIRYVQGYALEYLWCGEKQDEETYTYGSRLNAPINQIEEAVQRYVQEQHDRQVTMVIRLPEDIKKYVRDKKHEPPCLSLIDTEILEGKMHLTCYFRSWDAYAGLPANIAGLQLFNEAFVKEINSRGDLELETGKLVFHSKNCHIYQRQYKLVEELLSPKSNSKTQRLAQTMKDSSHQKI